MTLPSKPIMVRLPAELAQAFEDLKLEFPGLPQSMLLRFVISSVLERPIEERVRIVNEQIRGSKKSETKSKNRISGNTQNRKQ